jgi:hypothetical protein
MKSPLRVLRPQPGVCHRRQWRHFHQSQRHALPSSRPRLWLLRLLTLRLQYCHHRNHCVKLYEWSRPALLQAPTATATRAALRPQPEVCHRRQWRHFHQSQRHALPSPSPRLRLLRLLAVHPVAVVTGNRKNNGLASTAKCSMARSASIVTSAIKSDRARAQRLQRLVPRRRLLATKAPSRVLLGSRRRHRCNRSGREVTPKLRHRPQRPPVLQHALVQPAETTSPSGSPLLRRQPCTLWAAFGV